MKITKKMMAMLLAVLFVCTMLPLSSLARTSGNLDAGLLKEGSTEEASLEESLEESNEEEEGFVFGKEYTVLSDETGVFEFVPKETGPYAFYANCEVENTYSWAYLEKNGEQMSSMYLYDQRNDTLYLTAGQTYTLTLTPKYGSITVRIEKEPVKTLTANSTEKIRFEAQRQSLFYTFTAEKAGTYILRSVNYTGDPVLDVYDENWEFSEEYDDSDWDVSFEYIEELTAGETVNFEIHMWNSYSGMFDLWLYEATEATGVEIVPFEAADSEARVGGFCAYTANILPDTALGEATWSVSDEEVAEIEDGYPFGCVVRYLKTGTFTLTATLANGVKGEEEITVKDARWMELDREYTLYPGSSYPVDSMLFVPEEEGEYRLVFDAPIPVEVTAMSPDKTKGDNGVFGGTVFTSSSGTPWNIMVYCDPDMLADYHLSECPVTIKITKRQDNDGYMAFSVVGKPVSPVIIYAGDLWEPRIRYSPYGDGVKDESLTFETNKSSVVNPQYDYWTAGEPGKATMTVTGSKFGFSSEIPVEVIAPADLILGETVNTILSADEATRSVFKPEADGVYRISTAMQGNMPVLADLFEVDADGTETYLGPFGTETIDGKTQAVFTAYMEVGKSYLVSAYFDDYHTDKTVPVKVEQVEDPIEEMLVVSPPNKTTYCDNFLTLEDIRLDGLQLNVKFTSGKEELWTYDPSTGFTVGGEILNYRIDWSEEEDEATLCISSGCAEIQIPLTLTEEKDVLPDLHFTVEAPVAGAMPSQAVCQDGSRCWTEWTTDRSWSGLAFEAGKTYTMEIIYEYNGGRMTVDPNMEITVNGAPAQEVFFDYDCIRICGVYTATEPTTTTTTTTTTTEPTTTTTTATEPTTTTTATEPTTTASDIVTTTGSEVTPTTTTENIVTPTTTAVGDVSEDVSEDESGDQSDESGVSELVYGDGNGDGTVDMKDVLLLRKYLAGMTSEIDELNADVNEDKSLDMKDVLMIRKFLAHMIEKLGA